MTSAAMDSNLIIFSLFGGVFLLLYGIQLAGEGLKGWAGPRIKTTLETMTRNRFVGFLVGIVVTFLLQSSSATTVTLVSLIESNLLPFAQSLGVILGSDVGTTITVQLISFKIYDYALFICGLGAFILIASPHERRRHLGEGVLGFGLIFLSIKLMTEALHPLADSELLKDILAAAGQYPLLGIIISLALTAMIQSSAATIGITITLALEGLLTIHAALPIILGANIGTTATALLASLRTGTAARRAAVANLLFKVIGVVLCYPFLTPFADLMAKTSSETARQIANAHTVFNLGIAVLLLPFTSPFARLLMRWMPDKVEEAPEEFKPKYLNKAMLSTPSLALGQAARETMRMAEVVEDMLKSTLPALLECDEALIEKIEKMDNQVDTLDGAIRFYLTQLSKEHIHSDEAARQMEILSVVSNLEAIGDVIDKNLMENAKEKRKKCVQFSPEGQHDIQDIHRRVLENLELAMSAFTSRDSSLAEQVAYNKKIIRELEREYYSRHIYRLEAGLVESYETSSIHLDVLTNLKRINTHITNIVYPLLKSRQP